MKPNISKSFVENSKFTDQLFDFEMTDLPDHVLSEGPKIQLPKVIERLHENMASIPFSKSGVTHQENELLKDFENQFEMNLQNGGHGDRKTKTAYNKHKAQPLFQIKVIKEEAKKADSNNNDIYAIKPTVTLKSEISFMLKVLAEVRKLKGSTMKGSDSNIAEHLSCRVDQVNPNNIQKI